MAATTPRTKGERIRAARLASGLSQLELARAVAHLTGRKVGKASVSSWELGRVKNPENMALIALEAVTGHRLNWLVTGRGPRLASDPDSDGEPVLTAPSPIDRDALATAIRIAGTALGAMANPARIAPVAAGLYELSTTTPGLTEPALERMARMLATTQTDPAR